MDKNKCFLTTGLKKLSYPPSSFLLSLFLPLGSLASELTMVLVSAVIVSPVVHGLDDQGLEARVEVLIFQDLS